MDSGRAFAGPVAMRFLACGSTLLCQGEAGAAAREVGLDDAEDLAGQQAFEGAQGLALGLPLGHPASACERGAPDDLLVPAL